MHPSWRDLVIDQLRGDPAGRRRFLAACGTDGLTLALSHAGGVAGERTLPLATDCLNTLTRAWDRGHRPVPVFLLEAWYGLAAGLARPPAAPDIGPTWIELHPGSLLLENPNRSELARAEEWLALAELLSHHDPAALRALRFSGQDRVLLAAAIAPVGRVAADADLRDLAERVLARIQRLAPELAGSARRAIASARLIKPPGAGDWWAPEDLDAPPTTEPVAARDFTRADVARVLSDL